MTAPKKEQRIAAHRAPAGRTKLLLNALYGQWSNTQLVVKMLWKFNRRLFWQMTAGMFGIGFLFSFTVALVIGLVK